MPPTAESRSAGSRRGHARRAIREQLRKEILLTAVTGGTDVEDDLGVVSPVKLARWVARVLPDYVIDAIERATAD